MAHRKIAALSVVLLLVASTLAAPAEKPDKAPSPAEKDDLEAADQDDLKPAASHYWGGGWGYGGLGYGGYGGWGYPGYYNSYWGGYPSYGYGYGWGYPYYGHHGYWW